MRCNKHCLSETTPATSRTARPFSVGINGNRASYLCNLKDTKEEIMAAPFSVPARAISHSLGPCVYWVAQVMAGWFTCTMVWHCVSFGTLAKRNTNGNLKSKVNSVGCLYRSKTPGATSFYALSYIACIRVCSLCLASNTDLGRNFGALLNIGN